MKTVFIGILTLLSITSFASEKGNGGGSIVCMENSSISKAKLLDLREAELRGLLVDYSSDLSVEQLLEQALKKYSQLYPDIAKKIKQELSNILYGNVIYPSQERLPPPSDTGLKFLSEPINCFLEGVARYDDQRNILELNEDIYSNFSNTDKAALLFHEAMYRVQRLEFGHTKTSKEVRYITGALFAKNLLTFELAKENIDTAHSVCVSEDNSTEFYILYNLEQQRQEIHFTKVKGHRLVEKMILIDKTHSLKNEKRLQSGLVESKSSKLSKKDWAPYKRRSGKDYGTLFVEDWIFIAKSSAKYGLSLTFELSTVDVLSNKNHGEIFNNTRDTKWFFDKPNLYSNERTQISLLHDNGEDVAVKKISCRNI